jgi:hypothetical protein
VRLLSSTEVQPTPVGRSRYLYRLNTHAVAVWPSALNVERGSKGIEIVCSEDHAVIDEIEVDSSPGDLPGQICQHT